MLNFLKRKSDASQKPSAPARPRPSAGGSAKSAAMDLDPPPLPEVTEGNLESDWAQWEESVSFQDSQIPSGFSELESVTVRDDKVTEKVADPFATTRRRRT